MDERLKICGVEDHFEHGKLPNRASPISERLCANIDTTPYMTISETPDPNTPSRKCVEVTAKVEGRGSDNPFSFNEVLMQPPACSAYDTCPATGTSGYARPPGVVNDIITCTPSTFATPEPCAGPWHSPASLPVTSRPRPVPRRCSGRDRRQGRLVSGLADSLPGWPALPLHHAQVHVRDHPSWQLELQRAILGRGRPGPQVRP